MLSVTTIASGSEGNCLLVSDGETHILIDAGISCKRICTALTTLGIDPAQISAVLVTHEHSDHICGLTTMLKRLPFHLYTAPGTARQLAYRLPILPERLHAVAPEEEFTVGTLTCRGFATSHDAAQSMGYTVGGPEGYMALATDLGYVSDSVYRAVLGCQVLVVECNHDVDWLRTGPYPYHLKDRILGDRGHLCNEAGAELAARAVAAGAHTVILAHLSRENNTPARAYEVTRQRLAALELSRPVTLTVAPRNEPGPVYRVQKEEPVC